MICLLATSVGKSARRSGRNICEIDTFARMYNSAKKKFPKSYRKTEKEAVMTIINREIVSTAISFAENKHSYSISEDLLESLIDKIIDKKERMEFKEALRYSLNDLNLYNENNRPKRTSYRCAAAKYFSTISGLARSARSKRKQPPVRRKKKPSVTGTILCEPSGQYAFKL